MSVPVEKRSSIEVVQGKQARQTASLDTGSPPQNPGTPTSQTKVVENAKALEKHEQITCGKIGNLAARALAGAVGGPLYIACQLVGGGLSLAAFVSAAIICVPLGLAGAVAGGLIGTAVGHGKTGLKVGGSLAGLIPAFGLAVVEGVIEIPKALMFITVGRVGAGLTAFAVTGKREKTQLKGKKYTVHSMTVRTGKNKSEMQNRRKKSTHENLLDSLYFNTVPLFARRDRDIRRGNKQV